MKKFRLYYNKDKETTWLNEMASQGYAMTHFFAGLYTFEECMPKKYIYQIDFGDKLFGVSEDYRDFMRENKIEIVQTWGFWIILRKLTCDGDFLLYTDIDSSIEHYTKIRNMFKVCSILLLICFFVDCLCAPQSPIFFFFIFLMGLITFAIIHATFQTNQKINSLKEEKGEIVTSSSQPSPYLIVGLLLNSVALLSEPLPDFIEFPLRIFALVLILYGIVKTFSKIS